MINHVGYLVEDIEISLVLFEKMGFTKIGEIVNDELLGVKILFIKFNDCTVELVEPSALNVKLIRYLRKHGHGPYHLSVEVSDIESEIKRYEKTGFHIIVNPSNSVFFTNKKVAFMYHSNVGLVELIGNFKL
jgi:methylmalonyl-CoA/ethylmalonyl-CoA epimerase